MKELSQQIKVDILEYLYDVIEAQKIASLSAKEKEEIKKDYEQLSMYVIDILHSIGHIIDDMK